MSDQLYLLHLLMLITLFTVFLEKIKNIKLWLVALPITLSYSIYIGMMESIGLISLAWLAISAQAISSKNQLLKVFAHLSTIVTFIAIVGHLVPGFERITIIELQSIKPNSTEIYFKTSFDIFAATVIFIALVVKNDRFRPLIFLKTVTVLYLTVLITVFPLALFSGYIGLEFAFFTDTWSFFTLFSIFTMLQLTVFCPMEEAFFRGYFQNGLFSLAAKYKWLQKPFYQQLPVALPALLFGLTHLKGGVIIAISATIAGLTYGLAYKRTGRIESSIMLHYLVNLTLFLFFTYPSLLIK